MRTQKKTATRILAASLETPQKDFFDYLIKLIDLDRI